MGKYRKAGGFVAVSRSIFSHPVLNEGRGPFSKVEAFIWLFMHAAWRLEGRRFRFGVVELQRGEIAGTVRQWAKVWEWPATAVFRFLDLLALDGMIERGVARIGTNPGTNMSTNGRGSVTVLRSCNYDQYQGIVGGKSGSAEQIAEQNPEQLVMDAVIKRELFGLQTDNKATIENPKRLREARLRKMPRKGARWRTKIFIPHDDEDWKVYADDYRRASAGAIILPRTYADGKGNWFEAMGQPKKRA
jgi:hypothetical protein